ncbi:uncharacterized protein ASPGLDRAFT_23142 [Aspergillus glaucus CBS 516.65]|uniref:Uncharacterized protein n=1 Tax=Aspergillus glaucus CBS 516.65 TaxID=1160497 RepID=A0A1L9VT42_ASPGL|nr:hypothetical protein ASPGLDRAFT_23142 [Aspergillus glaucus CBS 516.65]OJJ87098.1 hypothetical protein ASPGLDRAFT_23142 [Aspergillus glaucus CBS 516.65]
MGLVVQEEEEGLCHKLARPVWGAASLINDLQSWDKEYKIAQAHGNHELRNAIGLLMKQHSIDAGAAKQRCCQKIKAFVAEYVQTLEYNKVSDAVYAQRQSHLGLAISTIVDSPSHYIDSKPSKGIRERTIDAINLWLQVPEQDLAVIKNVCRLLHGASLMLDDIEDSSKFRRGQVSTHTVFGSAQTINSAGYRVNEALKESYDLFWTFNLTCPSVEEYMKMMDYIHSAERFLRI